MSFTGARFNVTILGSGPGNSLAVSVAGAQQAGLTASGATLWTGNAASAVDLNPAGANASYIFAMSGSTQAGAAYFATTPHAALWSGAAASYTDIDPGAGGGSILYGLAGNYATGITFTSPGSDTHAGLWDLDTGTFTDLQSYIAGAAGPGYTSSAIRGVATDGSTLYLVGEAFDPLASSQVAVLITTAVPEPGTTALIAGLGSLAVAFLVDRPRRRRPRDARR